MCDGVTNMVSTYPKRKFILAVFLQRSFGIDTASNSTSFTSPAACPTELDRLNELSFCNTQPKFLNNN
jgi:hypothetical protein